MPKITVLLPCRDRPERTNRAIQSVVDQTFDDWELLVIGDRCKNIERMVSVGDWSQHDRIHIENVWFEPDLPSCGAALNFGAEKAKGEYTLFLANDDFFHPRHMEVRLDVIEGTGLDFVACPALIAGRMRRVIRYPSIKYGHIGHSELIVRTDMLRKYPHQCGYGHDWHFIDDMVRHGHKYSIHHDVPPTITVTRTPANHTWDRFD